MKTEKIIAVIILAALFIRFMHWPGAAPIIIVASGILSMVYFPLAFYFLSDKKIENQNLMLSIFSGMVFGVVPLGALFKFMYWPGAAPMLIVSCAGLAVVLPAVYFLKRKPTEQLQTYYKNMFTRTSVLCIVAFMFYLTPTSALIRIQCWDDAEQARLKTLYITNPDNKAYKEQYDDYIKYKDLGINDSIKNKY